MSSSFIRGKVRSAALVGLSVLGAVALGATIVGAATTINSNVNTGGTLTVSGHSSLTTASSTITSQTGNFLVNGFATTTAASGNIATEGTLTVNGNSTLGDAVGDSITANGYFTQVRVGTGTTFDNIGAVGADELGVEGALEVDGAAYFDGAVALTSTLAVSSATSTLATTTVANLLTVGSTTPQYSHAEAIVDGSGTTTLWLTSSSDTKGGCIQLENDAGVVTRVYVNGTTLRIEAGDCK